MSLTLNPHLTAHTERYVWHAPTRTAILSDLHLGFETQLAAAAGIAPDYSVFLRQWQAIVSRRPARVILAGDVFHLSKPAAETVALIQSWFAMLPAATEILITSGNHDPAMRTLRDFFGARVEVTPTADLHTADGPPVTIAHGHDLAKLRDSNDSDSRILILGHQHPAVLFADRIQSAKMICFAYTPALIILPTFSPLPIGVNMLTARKWILDLPMPPADTLQIAGIVRDQILDFGPLSGLG